MEKATANNVYTIAFNATQANMESGYSHTHTKNKKQIHFKLKFIQNLLL